FCTSVCYVPRWRTDFDLSRYASIRWDDPFSRRGWSSGEWLRGHRPWVCPTPSMQLAVDWLKADGGIAITAGHNPSPWNALKFVRNDGLYLNANQAEELLDIFHQGEFAKATWNTIETNIRQNNAITEHINRLKAAFDIDSIRSRQLVVAVDCCNGAC